MSTPEGGRPPSAAPAADEQVRRHPGAAGPCVVAIGGGRGLAMTLRAVRSYAAHVTAVVATADDSGSTGRLRQARAMPALGDLRRCLTAIAGADDRPLGQAFEHRFGGTDVEGHALGNLLLAGLAAVTGDYLAATDEAARLLGLDPRVGRVVPATVQPVGLRATTVDGDEVAGQFAVSKTEGIARVTLDPAGARAPAGLRALILDADQVVLGPGSVYTSILAAVLVGGLRSALASTAARRVYVCNLEPEAGETGGYDVAAHVAALRAHDVALDVVLVHEGGPLPLGDVAAQVVQADLARPDGRSHDTAKLAAALAALTPDYRELTASVIQNRLASAGLRSARAVGAGRGDGKRRRILCITRLSNKTQR